MIGISPDGADKHCKFRAKYGLKFPLLSDADHKVMEKYGAYGEKTLYGKKTVGRHPVDLPDRGRREDRPGLAPRAGRRPRREGPGRGDG